jgi:hypothetical protein
MNQELTKSGKEKTGGNNILGYVYLGVSLFPAVFLVMAHVGPEPRGNGPLTLSIAGSVLLSMFGVMLSMVCSKKSSRIYWIGAAISAAPGVFVMVQNCLFD